MRRFRMGSPVSDSGTAPHISLAERTSHPVGWCFAGHGQAEIE